METISTPKSVALFRAASAFAVAALIAGHYLRRSGDKLALHESATKPAPFLALPNELKLDIFQQVHSLSDLAAIKFTCRSLYKDPVLEEVVLKARAHRTVCYRIAFYPDESDERELPPEVPAWKLECADTALVAPLILPKYAKFIESVRVQPVHRDSWKPQPESCWSSFESENYGWNSLKKVLTQEFRKNQIRELNINSNHLSLDLGHHVNSLREIIERNFESLEKLTYRLPVFPWRSDWSPDERARFAENIMMPSRTRFRVETQGRHRYFARSLVTFIPHFDGVTDLVVVDETDPAWRVFPPFLLNSLDNYSQLQRLQVARLSMDLRTLLDILHGKLMSLQQLVLDSCGFTLDESLPENVSSQYPSLPLSERWKIYSRHTTAPHVKVFEVWGDLEEMEEGVLVVREALTGLERFVIRPEASS